MEPTKKGEKMKSKTEVVRREFNLTENESVIQDYYCALSHKQGRMYITQNYVLWIPAVALVGTATSIPFKNIQSIKKEKNALVFDNSMTIETTEPSSYFFSSFVHRDETYNLIEYLMKHPAYYIDVEEDDEPTPINSQQPRSTVSQPNVQTQNTVSPQSNQPRSTTSQPKQTSTNPFEDDEPAKNTNPFEDDDYGQQAYANIKVDTQASRNALRIAAETQEMGLATMSELTLQAEQLDRVEHGVERVHYNVDQANKILSHSKESNSKTTQIQDRTLQLTKREQVVEFDVLNKLPKSDMLVPAVLRLSEDKFMLCDMESRKAMPGSIWDYLKIDALVIRARHQHLDIRFSNQQRCRLCCSDIQMIVHEFSLKHPIVNVVFEPGTRKFVYGRRLAMAPQSKKAIGSGFFRKQANFTETAFKDAPEELKKQLNQQDNDLDELEHIVGNITKIATVMGEEIERQTDQIDHITDRVDLANERLRQTNKKIDQKLK